MMRLSLYFQALQTLQTRRDVIVCSECMKFLGNADFQMDILSGITSRQNISDQGGKYGDSVVAVPCENKCGELYCSSICADTHWKSGHKCLCTGKISAEEAERHPLIAFKEHACATNEIFLLVADVFSRICCEVEKAKAEGIDDFSTAVNAAMSPFSRFVRGLWWEIAVPPTHCDHEAFKNVLRELVVDSHKLLSPALDLREKGLETYLDVDYFSRTVGMFEQNNVGIRLENPIHKHVEDILSTEDKSSDDNVEKLLQKVNKVVERIDVNDCENECDEIGTKNESDIKDQDMAEGKSFEYLPFLNTFVSRSDIGWRVENTNEDAESEEGRNEDDNIVEDSKEEEEEEEEEEEDVNLIEVYDKAGNFDVDAAKRKILLLINQLGKEVIFPPLDGTAFYTLVCKVNHSCDPNAFVRYAMYHEHGIVAEMQLTKDIDAGEELTISYIDESCSYEKRRKLLRDYGFSCKCVKCCQQEQK